MVNSGKKKFFDIKIIRKMSQTKKKEKKNNLN